MRLGRGSHPPHFTHLQPKISLLSAPYFTKRHHSTTPQFLQLLFSSTSLPSLLTTMYSYPTGLSVAHLTSYIRRNEMHNLKAVTPNKKGDEILYVMTAEKANGEKGEAFEGRSCTISHTR